VRARNIYDYGDFSEVYLVEASDLPGKPIIPTVTLIDTDVIIAWEAPSSHFAVIEQYEILFMKADETYVSYDLMCDGSQPDIVAATSCAVPMLDIEPLTGLTTN
jgi:hypothetical protein